MTLRSLNGHTVEYSNLLRVIVGPGQVVAAGEAIGRAGPQGTGEGSLVWYKIRTGLRYFPSLGMESHAPDSDTSWTLEIGPRGEVSIRPGGRVGGVPTAR